ncbi:MAG: YkgJ family cysteine cluster protein [Aeromonadaceae bacterium]
MQSPNKQPIPIELLDHDAAIQCHHCAACCCRMPVLVLGDPLVPERYVREDESGLAFMAQGDDGWCIALDRNTLRCTIYEWRPQICRDFAMGGLDCQDIRQQTEGSSATHPR